MTGRTAAPSSPRTKARIAGFFYLLNILTGASALLVASPLRSAVLLAAAVCYIVVTVLFYQLFRVVSHTFSALAAASSLVGCALSVLGFFHADPFHTNPLVFFGCYCLLIGYLILRSTFLPRVLGVLMAFGGLGWLTFVSPVLSSSLAPYNLLPGIVGETALTVWLLAAGVNVQRWEEQAGAAANDR
ncbi:MAG: DUF4386 domain-containing protein [Gammaproteobacteria bacterium]|nr:DUF4386 domain-containing protein [Gammaproteobacteria bacterium]